MKYRLRCERCHTSMGETTSFSRAMYLLVCRACGRLTDAEEFERQCAEDNPDRHPGWGIREGALTVRVQHLVPRGAPNE